MRSLKPGAGRGPARREAGSAPVAAARTEEARLHGLNACLAAFARRPQDLRKAWLLESRLLAFKPLLAWCVRQRIGYRVVDADELARVSGSAHHEGVCLAMSPLRGQTLAAGIAGLAPGPALLAVLEGVGNPHNLGALLRSGAHFGLAGVVLGANDPLTLSGAAVRVAEGGAEAVPLLRARSGEDIVAALRAAGFALAATLPRAGSSLFSAALPARTALVFGAEGSGLSTMLVAAADLRLTIPGSGAVESLNIASSAAVCFAEWRRQHPLPPA
ncbi:MAG TPA: TrmH family RNA methyltransferase [Rhodanobacteraceae bacterium]|nr:TrmH family RNA methyltransferase [Rhodanobacteraceae bacterium]